jgi:hypothetical protein
VKSPQSLLGQVSWYVLAAVLAAVWPTFMLTKVLPSLVHASGSAWLQGVMDSSGALWVGAVGGFALGDLAARRSMGRRAFITATLLFGGVLVLSLGLSHVVPESFVHAYGLVWPPHLLFVLAAVALSRRQGFRRSTDYLGLLSWIMAGMSALGFAGWLVWRWRGPAGHEPPMALLVLCLGVGGVALVRIVRILRGFRAQRGVIQSSSLLE